jgi:CubicO group peptidase (beta-lactamase class C family)
MTALEDEGLAGMEKVSDPAAAGFDRRRLERVGRRVKEDVAAGRYDGARLLVSHHGQIVVDLCEGFADRRRGRALQARDVFHLFSVSKLLTGVLALKLVEDGLFRLNTPIASVIPEFGSAQKHEINVYHILTHTAGLPLDTPGVSAEVSANLQAFASWMFPRPAVCRPGERLAYSSLVGHSVLGLFMERICGRPFLQLMQTELLGPLGMSDTSFGLRDDLIPRICPVVSAPYVLEACEADDAATPALENLRNAKAAASFVGAAINVRGAVIPGGGAFSTAADMLRFAEMIRCGGEFGGARILSPAMIELASQNHTGTLRNEAFGATFRAQKFGDCPGYLGIGFFVRGSSVTNGPFGVLNSPNALGGFGLGATMCWVDPKYDLSMVFLSTGLMGEPDSWSRDTTLSDLVISSLID